MSPNLRNYGTGISIHGSKMTSDKPGKEALALIALLEEYVAEDTDLETPLCMKHGLCRKLEGHE